MKPVAIFRHVASEGPGYFATYLSRRSVPWQVLAVDQGEAVPRSPAAYSGLVFMGGPMSVNDDLPWIAPALELIRHAAQAGVPVLGHCLGAQLMARAFGGEVRRNAVKEIGWGEVSAAACDAAVHWLGHERARFDAFHWHGETFSIPPGAVRLATSRWCEDQAFALGPHLAMQFHVEMTAELIRAWCEEWKNEVEALARRTPSVQAPAAMLERVEERLQALHAVADSVYDRWSAGLSAR